MANFWIAPRVRALFEDVNFTMEHGGSEVTVAGFRCKWCQWTAVGCTMTDVPAHECTGTAADGEEPGIHAL